MSCPRLTTTPTVRTSFSLMTDGDQPLHDTIFFNIDEHAGPDIAFWSYQVDPAGRKRQHSYRLVVVQAKSRMQVTWAKTMKRLMPERAYCKTSPELRQVAAKAMATGPLSHPWIRVPVNHGGYSKTLCKYVMNWNRTCQALAEKRLRQKLSDVQTRRVNHFQTGLRFALQSVRTSFRSASQRTKVRNGSNAAQHRSRIQLYKSAEQPPRTLEGDDH